MPEGASAGDHVAMPVGGSGGTSLPAARAKRGGAGAVRAELEQWRQRCQAAERANEAKSLFLATMSHEIREPMNGVIGMTRLLLETPLSDEQQGFVEAVLDSGQALLTIINDILDLSRMEAGRLELDSIDFDLREPAGAGRRDRRAARAGQGPEAPARGRRRRCRRCCAAIRAGSGRSSSTCSATRVKFTPAGEVGLTVRLLAEGPQDVRLGATVRDTGIGIPEHLQGRSVHGLRPGRSLGAAPLRRQRPRPHDLQAPRRADGRRDPAVERARARARCFDLTLALAKPPETRPAPGHAPAEIAGTRLLIVDGTATTRSMMQQHTRSWSVAAEVADSGAAALARARSARSAPAGRSRSP